MHDLDIQEPTLLAIALAVIGLVLLVGMCILGILFVSAFGFIWWTFTGIAIVLAGLLFSFRRADNPGSTPSTGRQLWFGRIRGWGRLVLIGVLASWLGLIVWLAICPGGLEPPAKTDPALIRVITWNIHCGQDDGWPWEQFDWPVRKYALQTALEQAKPDILCIQEGRPEQVAFLEKALPDHRRVGAGRNDGKAAGEHCAIYFQKQRFEELAGSTFWLEEPIDQPRAGSFLDIKRICTWVRLRDKLTGRTFRVYNTHLYLTEQPRVTAATIVLDHIARREPVDPVLLTADFNASPSAASRQMFLRDGLEDSAKRAGKPVGQHTFQLYGIGVQCIDGILVDRHWRVRNHLILDVKPHRTFPSDHFSILVDVELAG